MKRARGNDRQRLRRINRFALSERAGRKNLSCGARENDELEFFQRSDARRKKIAERRDCDAKHARARVTSSSFSWKRV